MIRESDIIGYVKLCQRAEQNDSPTGKIKAYKKIKELMCKDQRKVFTEKGVSSDWVLWWWKAVESVHEHLAWRDDIDFRKWNEDHFEDIFQMEEIPDWIGVWTDTEYLWTRLHEDIGPGSKMRENQSKQKGFRWLNDFFPPKLNGNKPEVTPLDVVFCEMLKIIDGRFNQYARLAVVAGEAESEEEAKPSAEYNDGIFFRTIASDMKAEENLTDEDIEWLRKHTPREHSQTEMPEKTERKLTAPPDLEKKIKEYLKRADGIEKKALDEEKKYFALGQLLNYIDNENGSYVDEVEGSLERAEDRIFQSFLERWNLDADIEDWGAGEAVQCFLKAANKAINTKDSVVRFGGLADITQGFRWHPIEELYAAQPMLYALMKAIHKDMDYLRIQVNILTGKEISDQEPQILPHFNLKASETLLLAILDGLKNAEWKYNRVKQKGFFVGNVTEDEWVYIFNGPTHGRKAATRKITWKAKYACASFVIQFLDSKYETAEKVFNLKFGNKIIDINNLETTKIDRNSDICDEQTGIIAKIIREAMRKTAEVKSQSSSVK